MIGSALNRVLVLVSLLPLWAAVPPAQNVSCKSVATLTSPATTSATSPLCYRYTVPTNSPFLRIELEASNGGLFDLYVRAGQVTSLSSGDKVNPSAITGRATYAVVRPAQGSYTIAVVPSGKGGRFTLGATTSGSTSTNPSSSGSTCSYPLVTVAGTGIMVGSRFGDQVILPITTSRSGRIEAKATWTGTARSLTLYLYGAGQTRASASKTGSTGVTLSYDKGTAGKWTVVVVNSNTAGGTVSGTTTVTVPR
jgi:hypothetical protein